MQVNVRKDVRAKDPELASAMDKALDELKSEIKKNRYIEPEKYNEIIARVERMVK